jgi:diamine N-acetyltransferase
MGIRLVPLAIEHLDHVMTWVNDHDVMQYFATRQSHISAEEESVYLRALVESKTDRAYSIFDGDDYVGQCSINQIYWPARNGRIFIAIRKEAQGHAHGPHAVEALIARAWTELEMHKLWLIVRRDNRDAQAMYLKLGFDFEGVLRSEYCVGEKFFDMVRMSILNPG